jgi:hypothetical protein
VLSRKLDSLSRFAVRLIPETLLWRHGVTDVEVLPKRNPRRCLAAQRIYAIFQHTARRRMDRERPGDHLDVRDLQVPQVVRPIRLLPHQPIGYLQRLLVELAGRRMGAWHTPPTCKLSLGPEVDRRRARVIERDFELLPDSRDVHDRGCRNIGERSGQANSTELRLMG